MSPTDNWKIRYVTISRNTEFENGVRLAPLKGHFQGEGVR